MVVQGPSGQRTVAAEDFFVGFLETALRPDEMLVEIRVPRLPGARHAYQKFVKRAQDWAIVGAVATETADDAPAVALVNMGMTPIRASAVESALSAGVSARDAAAVADDGTSPMSDLNASETYRRHLSRVLVERALDAIGR